MNFFKVLAIISIISSWMTKALEDGRITLREALELIGLLAPKLGLPLDFEIGAVLGDTPPGKEADVSPDGGKTYAGGLIRPNQP